MKNKIMLLSLIFATSLTANIKKGKEIYDTYCANCHSVKMTGGMGKDLNIVSYTRTKEDIAAYVEAPGKMFRKFGYSANAMPRLPLSQEEIKDVADFIDSLQPFKKWMVKKR